MLAKSDAIERLPPDERHQWGETLEDTKGEWRSCYERTGERLQLGPDLADDSREMVEQLGAVA
ncbi:MAG: hypothetical protein ACYDHH_02420 [Solirubrobacteraceae bacterium]